MAETDGRSAPDRTRAGWRRLGVFWLTVLLLLAMGTGVIEWLGPPGAVSQGPKATSVGALHAPVSPPSSEHTGVRIALQTPTPPLMTGRDTPGPVTDPDPGLLEAVEQGSKDQLPRVAHDGRAAMRLYAAGFDHGSRRPRVGILVANIGMNEAESDAAIRALPSGVSLAVSPYATGTGRLLATARTLGHEYLLSLPLEPTGFPLNDPGPATLLTSAPAEANLVKLRWAMSRFPGYVGATGIVGVMRGERLAAMTDQMDMVLSELSERGLLYVDPREARGGVTKAWGRHVDLVIDDPLDRTAIDAKLAELEQKARDHGTALGLAMRPTPVAVARIAAWLNGLGERGMALAPVSALALAPAEPSLKVTERRRH